MPAIRLGQTVDIVLEHGTIKPSSVQDIRDDRIVLVQIVPPLTVSDINKIIFITYITREDRQVRMGFRAKVVEIREGYVTVGRGFPVIIVKSLSASKVCDLRANMRQLPHQELTIKLGDEDLAIINISDGDAHLMRESGIKAPLKVDDNISLAIRNGQEKYTRQARIVRQWHTKGIAGPEHLAIVFITEKLT